MLDAGLYIGIKLLVACLSILKESVMSGSSLRVKLVLMNQGSETGVELR